MRFRPMIECLESRYPLDGGEGQTIIFDELPVLPPPIPDSEFVGPRMEAAGIFPVDNPLDGFDWFGPLVPAPPTVKTVPLPIFFHP